MRLLIQRVKEASVTVDGQRVSAIGAGLLVFIGVFKNDGREQAAALAKRKNLLYISLEIVSFKFTERRHL